MRRDFSADDMKQCMSQSDSTDKTHNTVWDTQECIFNFIFGTCLWRTTVTVLQQNATDEWRITTNWGISCVSSASSQ